MAEPDLWCVNITGPDDVVATASREQAIAASMWFNQWWITNIADKGLHPNDPTMWAVPSRWPGSAESHAENIAKRGEPEYGAMFAAVASMTAPDPTNDAVSDERLREALQKFIDHYPSGINPSLDEAYRLGRDALNRRSVTSQASEGEDLWPNGLPEPTIDMLDLARNLPGMPSWVRAFARATAKDGSDAQRLEGIARALEVLSASPSKRVERMEAALKPFADGSIDVSGTAVILCHPDGSVIRDGASAAIAAARQALGGRS